MVLLLLGGILHLVASSSTNSLYNCTLVVNSSNPSAPEDCRCPPEGATVVCANLTSALLAVGNSTRVIVQEPQNHTLFPLPEFRWLHDVFLLGSGGSVRVTCEQNVSLSFVHSQRISVEGLKFYGCGALHYSTSRNFNVTNIYTKFEFLSFKASVYFESCEDIAFSNVTVANSDGIGLAMYGTIGENNFENCEFSDNSVEGNEWGGGGVFIEFPYCLPGKPQSCDIESFNYTDARYRFSLCNFTDNIAYADHPVEYAYFYPQDEYHLSFGRGGGLSVFLMSARNITLKLDDCRFVNNTAAWGGGLFLEFQGQSTNNTIEIYNTVFKHNHATDFTEPPHEFSDSKLLVQKTGGGGVRVGFAFPPDRSRLPSNNQVRFFETHFHNNSAYWGGGISFGTIRETGLNKSSNKLSFEQCHWVENYGRVGAAVELSLMYQATSGPSVEGVFTNCTFESNCDLSTSYRNNQNDTYIGGGTMTSNTITFSLMGNNIFVNNDQTGIIIVDASVFFMPDSYSNFTGNTGRTGGAIALWGHAFMKLHHNTHLYFIDNTAYRYGGAIAATAQSRHMNFRFLNCFIQYESIEVEPWNWDTYLYFNGNTGGNSNENRPEAISAVSLEACFWNGWGPTNGTEDEFKMMVFCWNTSRWVYDSEGQQLDCRDRNRSYLISSFAAEYTNSHQPYQLSVVPGESTAMKVGVSDDHFNKATEWTVYNVWSNTPKTEAIASESMFTTNGKIILYGEPKSTAKVYVETGNPRVIQTYINVSVRSCPPGFNVEEVRGGHHECICEFKGSFRGSVICDGKNSYQSRIRLGWWIGEYTVNGSIAYDVAAQSPFMSNLNNGKPFIPLEYDLNEQLCLSNHRNGRLCCNCTTGYGFAAYSRDWPCVKCTANQVKYTWLLYILVQLPPIGMFFFILWFLKFKATSGAVNGFICYAQLITTTFRISIDRTLPLDTITNSSLVTKVLRVVYLTVYDVWNLNFLREVWPSFCLSPSLNMIDLLVLDYIAAFFPFLLISILLCVNRLKPLSFSPLSAVATFLVLSFSRLTIISTRIVTPSQIYNKTGDHVMTVPYYFGAWDYFHDRHAVYVVLAVLIFLLFLFTPTVILMLYPFAGRFRCTRCLIDWIGKVSRQKIPLFLEKFYGCYKTNVHQRVVAHVQSFEDRSAYGTLEQPLNLIVASHDYRCTAGLYFLLRIILFVTHMGAPSFMQVLVIQQIVVTVAILYFSIFRPYVKDLHNNLDALTFTVLGTINIISIFNSLTTARGQPLSSALFAIQYCLVFLPLAWMIVGILYFNRKGISEKFQPVREKLVKVLCWQEKNEHDDVLLSKSVSSTSTQSSSAECAQADDDLTISVRFLREESCSANELEHCHSQSCNINQLVQRSKGRLSTGRPSSSQLQSTGE